MCIAEGNVSNRYPAKPNFFAGFGNGNVLIGQSRSADCRENLIPDLQPFTDAEAVADSVKSPLLPLLGSLSVADMQGCSFRVPGGRGDAEPRFLPSAERTYRLRLITGH